jgi:hypothetical protein
VLVGAVQVAVRVGTPADGALDGLLQLPEIQLGQQLPGWQVDGGRRAVVAAAVDAAEDPQSRPGPPDGQHALPGAVPRPLALPVGRVKPDVTRRPLNEDVHRTATGPEVQRGRSGGELLLR